MIAALTDRYGHRGAWLICLGAAWVVFGIGVLLEPIAPRSWVLHEAPPTWVQAALWWVTGGAALVVGLRTRPGRHDTWGHVALYVMPAIRVASYLLSWLLWLASTLVEQVTDSGRVIGYPDAWYAALVWLLIAAMLRLVTDWPDPRQSIPRPPVDAAERM